MARFPISRFPRNCGVTDVTDGPISVFRTSAPAGQIFSGLSRSQTRVFNILLSLCAALIHVCLHRPYFRFLRAVCAFRKGSYQNVALFTLRVSPECRKIFSSNWISPPHAPRRCRWASPRRKHALHDRRVKRAGLGGNLCPNSLLVNWPSSRYLRLESSTMPVSASRSSKHLESHNAHKVPPLSSSD